MASEPFRYLDASLLRELHAVVVASRCAPKALLSGIDPRFVASLDNHVSGAADLLATLHRLNETRHLREGEVPFELWLSNASALVGHLPDAAAVVERAFAEVRKQRAARDPRAGLLSSGARAHVHPDPVSTHEPSGDAYLVIICHPDASLVGQRRMLTQDLTRIGRGGKNVDWALSHKRISRQQCYIERRGDQWLLHDLGSKNGTWVNNNRLEVNGEQEIAFGDRIQCGEVVLRFFSRKGVLSDHSRTLFEGGPVDGLTRLPSRASILDQLNAAMAVAARDGRKLHVLAIYVDQMDRKDDDELEPIGDYVLQELARVLTSTLRPGDTVGRLEGNAFLMVLPDTDFSHGYEMASLVQSTVRSHPWGAEGERLQATLSIGLAESLSEARKLAGDALVRGGDAICDPEAELQESLRTYVRTSPEILIEGCPLYVFGMGDEKAVIRLGQATWDLWQHQLSHVVRPYAHSYTLFKGHLFVTSRVDESDFLHQVQTRWASFPVPLLHQRTLVRSLRWAALSQEEVSENGMRSYDILLERLHHRSMGSLPFPLVALRPIASTHPSEYVRAKTLCDAIDASLRFITAVELAALRDVDNAAVRAEVAAALAGYRTGQPLTMAAWYALAFQLAKLAVRQLQGPLQEAARSLAELFSHALAEAVARSARYLSHTPPQHESSYTQDRAFFEAVLDRITEAMHPLTRLRLVSVAGIDGYDEDGETTIYQLSLYQGPSERFPLVRQRLAAKLVKNDWCYLIGAPVQSSLLLSPIVAALPCAACGKIEVFMADTLVLGPKGVKARVKAITTTHEAWVPVPFSEASRLLYEAVMR